MFTLLFYFFASHIVSFVCSILEAVLLCCTTPYISALRKRNPPAGEILYQLKKQIDRPLAAILTLNTGAHTFGAAGVGAQVVELFGNYWLGIASVLLTLTMLFFTEMIPKTVGALYWKKLAPSSAYFIKMLIFITYPFVVTFEAFAKILARGAEHEKVTEEEIKLMLVEGTEAGILQEAEHDMMESIFRLGSRRVSILMTPRLDIEWLDLKDSPEAIRSKIEASNYSRFPVCDGELDKVIGIASSKGVLKAILTNGTFDIRTLTIAPLFVPENMRVLQLVELFKKTPDNIALVTDEYGSVVGLVTLHDVLESIVGDLPQTAHHTQEQSIVQRKDGSWIIDGMLPIDEFKGFFDLDELPDETKGSYRTVAGFCMKQIGNIPRVGDIFVWDEMRFKIVKMDGRRVEKVLIHLLQP